MIHVVEEIKLLMLLGNRLQPNLVHISLYVCVRILCMFYIYIYIYLFIYLSPKHHFPNGIWMIHVVEEIKLLLLLGNRFQPNLVHILLYVCVRILCMLYIYIYIYPKHQFPKGILMIHVVEEIKLLLYVCVRILCMFYVYIYLPSMIFSREFGSFTLLRKSNYCCC
jgi:hypothetical protein